MRKFRLLTLVLCAALLAGAAGAAFTPVSRDSQVTTWGAIESIDGSSVHIKNSSEQNLSDVIVHIPDGMPIIDAVTGAAVKLSDLKVGDSVYVCVAPVMTLSMPPQTTGLAMVVNLPADYKAPEYGVAGQVSVNESGETEVLNADNTLLARITKDTKVLRYTDGAAVSAKAEDLKPGTPVYFWYGVSTKSIPAQANLDQILILPSQYAGFVTIGEGAIAVNGKALALSEKTNPIQAASGNVLVPLRLVAEAAGWTVAWSANDAPIQLTKGDVSFTVTIGADTAMAGETEQYLPQATALRGGVTFVDSTLLETCMNLYAVIGA